MIVVVVVIVIKMAVGSGGVSLLAPSVRTRTNVRANEVIFLARNKKIGSGCKFLAKRTLMSSRNFYESLRSNFCETLVRVSTSRTDRLRMLTDNGYDTYFSAFVMQFPFF